MAWFTRSLRFTILATIVAVALTLGQAVNVPAQESGALRPDSLSNKLPNQWEFSPPSGPTGSDPVNTQGGATRGGMSAMRITHPHPPHWFQLILGWD
jgi:hypothetical protein